jgi:hypothetical protein
VVGASRKAEQGSRGITRGSRGDQLKHRNQQAAGNWLVVVCSAYLHLPAFFTPNLNFFFFRKGHCSAFANEVTHLTVSGGFQSENSRLYFFCLSYSHPDDLALLYNTAMNEPNFSSHSGPNWLPHPSIELNLESIAGESIEGWLGDVMRPLGLPSDFSSKVLTSARDSVTSVPEGIGRIRLLVFTPAFNLPDSRTWGFFRIIKNVSPPVNPPAGTYEIAFYLYVDSHAAPG